MKDCIPLFCLIVVTLLSGAVPSVFAQNPADKSVIQVGENVHLSREMADRVLVEPNLAADFRNPNHLLGVSIVASTPSPWAATQDCAAFVTFDGGKTWSSHKFGIQVCGDPWVTIGADGTAYFIALGNNGLVAFRSPDGGRRGPTLRSRLAKGTTTRPSWRTKVTEGLGNRLCNFKSRPTFQREQAAMAGLRSPLTR